MWLPTVVDVPQFALSLIYHLNQCVGFVPMIFRKLLYCMTYCRMSDWFEQHYCWFNDICNVVACICNDCSWWWWCRCHIVALFNQTVWVFVKLSVCWLWQLSFNWLSSVNIPFHNSPYCFQPLKHFLRLYLPLWLCTSDSLSCCLLSTTATFSEGLVARRQDWLPIVCRQRWRGCVAGLQSAGLERIVGLGDRGCVREREGGWVNNQQWVWRVERPDTLNASYSTLVTTLGCAASDSRDYEGLRLRETGSYEQLLRQTF